MKFDFITLFNKVALSQVTRQETFIPVTSMGTGINTAETGLDSLELILVFAVLGDMFSIPDSEELRSLWPVDSLTNLQKFLNEQMTADGTADYTDIDELVEDFS